MERWRVEFHAEHGQRFRYLDKRWWMLDDQGFWTQGGAWEELYRILYASPEARESRNPGSKTSRLISELSRDLRTKFLPGRESRDVWPQDPGQAERSTVIS